MHVLFIGRDRQALDRDSPLVARWRGLVAQGVTLTILLLCERAINWEEPGIRVIGTGGTRFIQRLWKAFSWGRHLKGIDLVSAQDPAELGLLAYILGRNIGAKVEIQDHGGWFDGSLWIDEPLWWLRKRCADWLLPRVDRIRTVNPQSFVYLKKRFGGRAYFLPIACAERFFTAHYRPIAGRIVCVARFVPVKRHRLLLRAFVEFSRMNSSASLVLVGSGPLESDLRSFVEEHHLTEKVQFIQTMDPLLYLECAQAFVLLSSHEGWGVAAMEAAAVGVPVLMTDTGCAPWLEERGLARCVRDLDPSKIAEMLGTSWERSAKSIEIPHLLDIQREQVAVWRSLFSV